MRARTQAKDGPRGGDDVLKDSTVVQHVATKRLTDGFLTQRWEWPAQAVGIPLTVRFSVESGGVSETFLYPIKVRATAG